MKYIFDDKNRILDRRMIFDQSNYTVTIINNGVEDIKTLDRADFIEVLDQCFMYYNLGIQER